MKHYREARETYLAVLSSGFPIEPSVEAAIHRAIGFAAIELGNYDQAEKSLVRSIELHRRLMQPIEVIQDDTRSGGCSSSAGIQNEALPTSAPSGGSSCTTG